MLETFQVLYIRVLIKNVSFQETKLYSIEVRVVLYYSGVPTGPPANLSLSSQLYSVCSVLQHVLVCVYVRVALLHLPQANMDHLEWTPNFITTNDGLYFVFQKVCLKT